MKKYIWSTIAIIMAVGTIILVSCNNGIELNDNTTATKLAIKAESDKDKVTVLQIMRGKKVSSEGSKRKTCVGNKGTCWLWFGGLFLSEDFNLEKEFPENLASNPKSGIFISERLAGVHAAPVVRDSLDLLVDYSCVDRPDANKWVKDIRKGVSEFNETIVFDDIKLLNAWGFKEPVAIPAGDYVIRSSNTKSSQYFIRVPIVSVKE